jgi:hypothetical protein
MLVETIRTQGCCNSANKLHAHPHAHRDALTPHTQVRESYQRLRQPHELSAFLKSHPALISASGSRDPEPPPAPAEENDSGLPMPDLPLCPTSCPLPSVGSLPW